MTIIVSVKIHDGVVMAADSATTFYLNDVPGQIYLNANKIVNLYKGLPIGVMTCGRGGIGQASIATLLKDLREKLGERGGDAAFDPQDYTMESVADRVRAFFVQRAEVAGFDAFLKLRICGYSAGRPSPEVWEVMLKDGEAPAPTCIQQEIDIGPRWDGEYDAMDRIIFGLGTNFVGALVKLGHSEEQAAKLKDDLFPALVESLILPAAPIQDAIALARYMVETTMGFIRFSVTRTKTVGGPIEIAAITKHEGFRWVERKHFFPQALNP